jgi:hypothetical protein
MSDSRFSEGTVKTNVRLPADGSTQGRIWSEELVEAHFNARSWRRDQRRHASPLSDAT